MITSFFAYTIEGSYNWGAVVPIGGSQTLHVSISGAPSNAIITKVEAKFSYIAYGVVQNYVSARFNRGSDPGDSGGLSLVNQGNLPSGNPGTYGYISYTNWNGQAANSSYFFRFKTASGSPYGPTINSVSVKITYIIPPNLSSPSNYSIYNRNNTSSILLSWSGVSGATEYWVNVFPAGASGSPVFNQSVGNNTSASISCSSWSPNIYIWQVRAGTTGVWTSYSSPAREFIVDLPANAPSLTSPSSGYTCSINDVVSFSWNSVPSAARYAFKINTSGGVQERIIDPATSPVTETMSTAFYTTGAHTWSVRAIKQTPSGYNSTTYENTMGWGQWTSRSFTINPALPPPPTLNSPSNYSIYNRFNTSSITFSWSPVSGATNYWLYIFPSGASGSPVYNQSVGSATSISTPCTSWSPNIYIWQVRAGNAAGWGSYSSDRQFVVDVPPSAPSLTSPANGASVSLNSAISFQWNASSDSPVNRYNVRIVAGTDLNATPLFNQEPTSLSQSVSTSGWSPGTYTWGVRAIKTTPNSSNYPQLTYEQTISWGGYNTRTFIISTSGVGVIQSLSCTATRSNPSTIFALPSSTEYGGLEPYESEKNFKASFKIQNNGSTSITFDDVGVYVTGGNSTNFRITLGTPMTLAAGQVSSLFDKRGYLMDNQLTGGSTTSYTGQIQINIGTEWFNVSGTGSQCSFSVAPRPAIDIGMLVKRPRNISTTNPDAAAVYKTQYGRKWQGTATAFNNLFPTWGSEIYVYPIAVVNALANPSTPTHDNTIPVIAGRNLLYKKISTGDVFIIEPEPNTTTPLKSRWFVNQEAFASYGYGAGVLAQESIALSNSQVDWLLTQYLRGTDISLFGLLEPSEGESIALYDIYFEWGDVGADYYELLVDNNQGFGSPEVSTDRSYVFDYLTETSYTLTTTNGLWLSQGFYYWKVIAHFSDGSTMTSSVGTFIYDPIELPTPIWVPLYRSYIYIPPGQPNGPTQEHFYCAEVPGNFHLQYALEHGYSFEKVEGFVSLYPFETTHNLKGVYRLFNETESSHVYTTDGVQRDALLALGTNWKYEGITGFTTDSPNNVPFYHVKLINTAQPSLTDYFYTTSEIEKNRAVANGYTNMGIMCYLSLDGDGSTEASPITQPTAGRGINPYNGNLAEYSKDVFSIPGGKMSLDFSFSYNSYSTKLTAPINPVGSGWNHNYNSYIYITPTRLFVFWPDGKIHVYNSSSPYGALTPGVYDTMQRINASQYRITKKDQTTLTFNVLAGYSTVASLSSIQDRNNNSLSMVYDANDRLSYVTDRFGRRLQFYYYPDTGKKHLVHHVADTASGRSVYFNYDNHYNLVSFQDAKGYSTQYTYEDTRPYAHLLTSIAYPNGNVVSCLYDSSQRITNQTVGSTGQSLVVSGYSSPTSRTVSDGGITSQYSYYQGVYAKIQQLSTPDVAAGFQYSDTNNPTLPTTITDGSGNTTSMTYDSKGNVLTITKPGGISHQYTYNTINDITQYRDPLNHYSYFGYTSGNLTSVQTPRGTTSYQYGSYGKLTQTTSPIGQQTTFSYDSYDNIASVTQPLGLTTSYSYDAISRVTSTTNPMSQTTTHQYDANDNLTSFTEFGDVTSYTYDQNDNLISVSKNGQTTSMQYNNMELMSQISNPIGNISSLYYNPNGTLQSIQKPVGSISYSYNSDGTVSAVNSQDAWANYTYNGNRKVTNISDNNGSISFGYDTNNRVTSINSNYGFAGNVSYSYDAADNIASMTFGGHTVQYTYWDDNLLRTVRDWNNRVTTFTYRADGSLSSIQYPNGIVCSNGYDTAGRLTSLSNSGSSSINSYSYTLNALGFHTSVIQTEPLEPFPMPATNLNCTYDNANRIITAGNSTFTHNGNGCMTSRSEPQTNYSWDTLDRLLSISGSSSISYTYDALGNRRSRTENSVTTRYVLDLNSSMTNVLIETDASGNPANYYVYANGMLISRIKPNGDTRYYHYDSRGSTIAMTNQTQQITHKYSYNPYGRVITMLEEDANPFRFVGGWGVIDEGNGLSYMRARYYDQSFGRFISQDPIWNSNLYEYSANDPINFSDPSGLFLSDISTERFIKQGILAVAKYRSNSTSLRSANSLLKANKLLGKFEDAMAIYVLASKGYYSYKSRSFGSKGNKAEIITSEVSAQAINGLIELCFQSPLGVKGLLQATFWVNKSLARTKSEKQWFIMFEKEYMENYNKWFKEYSGDEILKLFK